MDVSASLRGSQLARRAVNYYLLTRDDPENLAQENGDIRSGDKSVSNEKRKRENRAQ